MHAEIEGIKTKLIAAELSEQAVMSQLFEVRERIVTISNAYDRRKAAEMKKLEKKMYDGPARKWDEAELKKQRIRENKAKQSSEWKGQESIEDICRMYMDFLTTPTFGTFIELENENKLLEKTQNAVKSEMKKAEKSHSKIGEPSAAVLKEQDLTADVIDEAHDE